MSKTLNDPPKASKIRIKKVGRGNEFNVGVNGGIFEVGEDYLIQLIFPQCETEPFNVEGKEIKFAEMNGYITDTCLGSAYSPGEVTHCTVTWLQPVSSVDENVPVDWLAADTTEQTGFLQKIINFFKRLFGRK